MRELKFRVWDEKYHCWDNSAITCYPNEDFKKQGRTIQLSTGLTDCKGNNIYEGDIVEWGDLKYVVEWNDDSFCWQARCPYYHKYHHPKIDYFRHIHYLLVLGNIFENKELLK